MTTTPTSLSAVERTEIKWALRSRNALARYLNWMSLRTPWIWRIRLDIVLLLNAAIGLVVLYILATLPDEQNQDYYISSVVGFMYLGVSLAVLAAAFFWAFTVTKSVRARAAPRLGPKPGIFTSILVCLSFGAWIAIAGAGPYVSVLRDAGTGEYRSGYDSTPAAVEAPAAAPESGPAIGASDAAAIAAAQEEQAKLAEEEAARETARVSNLRRAGLWGAMFGKEVHGFWAAGRYSYQDPTALAALGEFIQETPRWRDDASLRHVIQSSGAHGAYAYPGLLEDFKNSERYNNALVQHFANDNSNAGVAAFREMAEATPADMRRRFRTYLSDLYHDDPVLNSYITSLRSYVDTYDTERSSRLSAFSQTIDRYEEQDRYDPLDSEEFAAYLDTYRAYRRLLEDRELNQRFQESTEYQEYLRNRFQREVREGQHADKIRAERGFHEMVQEIEGVGDPSRSMPEQQLRRDLLSNWVFGAVTITIAALFLAVFVTSLNRVGLGATLGSMGLAAVFSAVIGVIAGSVATTALYRMLDGNQYGPVIYLSVAAFMVLIIPLILPIRDVLTKVRRRWSRPFALAAIWSSIGWFPIIIAAFNPTDFVRDMHFNDLTLWALFTIAAIVSVALFAKLIFALVARISTYPQPG